MEKLPTVEGLTPTILWYTLAGVVGLAALFLLAVKVSDAIRGIVQRRRLAQQPTETLADAIGEKVLEKLEPRFEEIDRKLGADKTRLDAHERALAHISETEQSNRDGFAAVAGALIAVLDHELHNGNTQQMEKARDELNHYLTHRK